VVINEIAWMGGASSFYDEWIELYNAEDFDLDLHVWQVAGNNKGPTISLKGLILSHSFFILERTDDESVPEISADQIYKGSLSNQGEILQLINKDGIVVDEVDCSKQWFAGDNETKQTMERKDPQLAGNIKDNWQTSHHPGGTPKKKNSEGIAPAKETEAISLERGQEGKQADAQNQLGGSIDHPDFLLISLISLLIAFCGAVITLVFKKYILNLILRRD